ncbi:MAG: glucose-6-phosphate isomerase [Lachnospiraceae bacterium]|nr:glucose-6-phosphate isomerase [Lachnospiraceae bacterium]
MNNIEMCFFGIDELTDYEMEQFTEEALFAQDVLLNKRGPGAEFTGWVDLPVNYDKEEFARIKKAAEKIRSDSKALVVCGIGGSYLGAAAALDFLKGGMYNLKCADGSDLQIFFAGNNMNATYIKTILDLVKDKDFSLNVISKSGTTMETSISFRIFRKALEDKYGKEEAAERIYATTDKEKGALKTLADKEGYETFVVPDDIGGRYSVLTAVGLLPIAAAGCDIDQLMEGAAAMREELTSMAEEKEDDEELIVSDVVGYAALRQQLYSWDKFIEIFESYDPDLKMFSEWLKQLFGESEGKDGYGIFPASLTFTTDLHSMGQMIQDGERNIFETIIEIKPTKDVLGIPAFEEDFDGFKYLEGKNVDWLNLQAMAGTCQAHSDGDVPQILFRVPERSEFYLGQLFYFFEYACGISAYVEGVNPFNQPGVETYKKNIKEILAKYKK